MTKISRFATPLPEDVALAILFGSCFTDTREDSGVGGWEVSARFASPFRLASAPPCRGSANRPPFGRHRRLFGGVRIMTSENGSAILSRTDIEERGRETRHKFKKGTNHDHHTPIGKYQSCATR